MSEFLQAHPQATEDDFKGRRAPAASAQRRGGRQRGRRRERRHDQAPLAPLGVSQALRFHVRPAPHRQAAAPARMQGREIPRDVLLLLARLLPARDIDSLRQSSHGMFDALQGVAALEALLDASLPVDTARRRNACVEAAYLAAHHQAVERMQRIRAHANLPPLEPAQTRVLGKIPDQRIALLTEEVVALAGVSVGGAFLAVVLMRVCGDALEGDRTLAGLGAGVCACLALMFAYYAVQARAQRNLAQDFNARQPAHAAQGEAVTAARNAVARACAALRPLEDAWYGPRNAQSGTLHGSTGDDDALDDTVVPEHDQ